MKYLSAGETKWFYSKVGEQQCIVPLYRCRRYNQFKSSTLANVHFQQFVKEANIVFNHSFHQVQPNFDAAWKGISKYNHDSPRPNAQAWEYSNFLCNRFLSSVVLGSRILSYEESVSRLDLSTSPGYPHTLAYTNKRDMIAKYDVRALCDVYYNSLTDDSQIAIWTCTQKRELRSDEKLKKNSIRVFTAAPIEVTICDNRLCADFNDRLISHYGERWIQVGMSQFRRGWHQLAMRLSRHPNLFDADGHNWDGSMTADLLFENAKFRFDCMSSEFAVLDVQKKLMAAYRNMLSGMCVTEDGILFMKLLGMNSGWVNTIVDNSLCWVRLIFYAWCVLVPPELRNLSGICDNLECAIYGDDLIISVSDLAVSHFNIDALSMIVQRDFGVELTTECHEPRKIHQMTFLNHEFVMEDGVYLPSINFDKMMCSLMYGCTVVSPLMNFYRALSLRQVSWGNARCRKVIYDFICWELEHHGRELRAEVYEDLTFENVMRSFFTDRMLKLLYTGLEGGVNLKQLAALNIEANSLMNFASDSSELKFVTDFTDRFKGFPIYKEYGGPGYTGSVVSQKGDYSVVPKDAFDNLFRRHDNCYDHSDRRDCDLDLAREAGKLGGLRGRTIQAFFSVKGYGGNANRASRIADFADVGDDFITAPRLVGIEPNPGPKGGKKKGKNRNLLMKKKKKGNGPRATISAAPTRYGVTLRRPRTRGDNEPEVGTIRLARVTTPAAPKDGTILGLYDLAPSEVGGRVSKIASLHQKYRFLGGKLRWVPSTGTETDGQIVFSFDRDTSYWPSGTTIDPVAESQKMGVVSGPIYKPFTFFVPGNPTMLFTHEDEMELHTTSPGFVTVSCDDSAVSTHGSVHFDYAYQFYDSCDRPEKGALVYRSYEAAANGVFMFPLRSDGTDTKSNAVVAAGDEYWKAYVTEPTDLGYNSTYYYVKLAPYTHVLMRWTGVGTGLVADAAPGYGLVQYGTAMTVTTVYSEVNAAQTVWTGEAIAYTTANPAFFRVAVAGFTTNTFRELLVVPLAYEAVYPATAPPALTIRDSSPDSDIDIVEEPCEKKVVPLSSPAVSLQKTTKGR